MRRGAISVLLAMLLLGWGCADVDEPSPEEETGQSGVELTVDFLGETDVAGFKFVIRECSDKAQKKGDIVKEKTKDLEDLSLPGMIPNFENDPFDERSTHLFADWYTSLAPGCYDVKVIPVTKSGEDSQDCQPDAATGVIVEDGETTEILLISQCDGKQSGGIDVVAAINHPPEITDLKFKKFNHQCDRVKVCATAFEPDGDPMEFVWEQIDGPKLSKPLKPKDKKGYSCPGSCEFEDYDEYLRKMNEVKKCVTMRLGEPGTYQFKLSVFDLMWEDGTLVRFPDSSATFKFPIHAAEKQGVECPVKKSY